MRRNQTTPDTRRIRHSDPNALADELTRLSAEGWVCTDIRYRRGAPEATLAPAPDGEPYRLFHGIPWNRFWQPEGWDYAFSDGVSHYYITYPLPLGTVAEAANFAAEEAFAEEQDFLSDHARRGLHLIAVRGSIDFFLPAEPADLHYTVIEGRLTASRDHALIPPATTPDEEGHYFFTFGDSGRAYFADAPSKLPPREGHFPDHAAWRAAFNEYHRGTLRMFRTVFGGIGLVAAIAFSLLDFFEQKRFSWKDFGISMAVSAGLLALVFAIVTLILRRSHQKTLSRIQSEADYPRVPPNPKPRNTPAVPAADEHSRIRALQYRRLTYGLVVLLLTVVMLFSLHTILTFPNGTDGATLVESVVALLFAPFALVFFAVRFVSLSRKLRSMRTEKKTDDSEPPEPAP